jgi:hypothetical protein
MIGDVPDVKGIDNGWITRMTLKVEHWRHFGWLAQNGKDMDDWTQRLDVERHSHDGFHIILAGYNEMGLVQDDVQRHRAGEDVPLYINPDLYVDVLTK